MGAMDVLSLLWKRLMGGGVRAAGSSTADIFGAALGGGAGDGYTPNGYPTEFSPKADHYYDLVTVAPGVHNTENMNDPNIDLGGLMQTLEEHEQALNKYVRPGMTPKEKRVAMELGKQEEEAKTQWWLESFTRDNAKFNVSSSAIQGIRVTPDGHVEIKWKGKPPKTNRTGWYTFGQFANPHEASKAAVELMHMPSIGRAVLPYQRNGKYIRYRQSVPGMCVWNKKYYNGTYAK